MVRLWTLYPCRPPCCINPNHSLIMATIAEIIAAKKRNAVPAAPKAPQADPAVEAAIDRIDPPSLGKRRAGLVLSASTPLSQAEVAEKAHYASKRLEVPAELIQPADDEPMCLWVEKGVSWLCMPCADKSMPPIKVLRLPWSVWPAPAPQPLPTGDPF